MTQHGHSKPTASLIVLGYNQEAYIHQAIESALAQTYQPLEVLLSDDSSCDSTFDVMTHYAQRYSGPHRIVLNRTRGNQGIVEHFDQAIKQVGGEAVIYMAGDDISVPSRVQRCVQALFSSDRISFVESRYIDFRSDDVADVRGNLEAPATNSHMKDFRDFSLSHYLEGCTPSLSSSTRAFRRNHLLRFPSLDSRLRSEDTSCALRLLYCGCGRYLNAPLLYRRRHENNATGPEAIKKMDFDLIKAQYLADAAHAVRLGLIRPAELEVVGDWASKTIQRRKLRVLFDLGYPDLRDLIWRILPSRVLRGREKVYAGRRFLTGLLASLRS